MNVTSTHTYTEDLFDKAILFFAVGLILILFSLKTAYAAHLVNEDTTVVLGILLISAGVFRGIPAYFQMKGRAGTTLTLLSIPALVAGLALLLTPHLPFATYNGVVAAYLTANAVLGLGYVHLLKPYGWGRYVAASLATFAMAVAAVTHWPVAGVWGVSLALGAALLIDGLLMISAGNDCWKKARRTRHILDKLIEDNQKGVAS